MGYIHVPIFLKFLDMIISTYRKASKKKKEKRKENQLFVTFWWVTRNFDYYQ